MVRAFESRPLEPASVERILAAALRAPSAGFTQGVDMVVLEGPGQTARYWDASLPPGRRQGFAWPGLLLAPLLVVVVSSEAAYRRRYAEQDKVAASDDAGAGFEVPWWHVDAAFCALLLQLAALDARLGASFFQAHRPEAVSRALGIPEAWAPVGTVAVGHPAPDRPSSSASRPRRPADEVVHRGGC
jgi:nitroreductase